MRVESSSTLGRILRVGNFEEDERRLVERLVAPGDLVVDVGANDGLFTLICAARVGESGEVIAFEPSRRTFRRLNDNVQLNNLDNVRCFCLALSDGEGEANLYSSTAGHDAWNSLAGDLTGTNTATESVTLTTWEKFVELNKLARAPSLMKIDVEGWEIPVIRGASRLLSSEGAPILQVEFTRSNAAAAGTSTAALFDELCSVGYEQFLFDGKRDVLVRLDSVPDAEYCNVYALKESAGHFKRVQSAGLVVSRLNGASSAASS